VTAVEELRRVPILDALEEGELREVPEGGIGRFVPAGEIHGREGKPVEHLYVILEGELRITKEADDGGMTINVYTPRAFCAELPLLAGTPFLATGRALTDCRLFLIPEDLFGRLLTNNAAFSNTVLPTMADGVRILQSLAGQREHLNSLSTLAAGLAHKLNNPASATRRSAEDPHDALVDLWSHGLNLDHAAAEGKADRRSFDALERLAADASVDSPAPLDTLERSEREEELALWLEDLGLEEGWDLAPAFVVAGLDAEALQMVADSLPHGPRADALCYLGAVEASGLLDGVEGGAVRVSEIVGSMDDYAYLDRARCRTWT
jgi:CRP-like cAMP-binding protein